MKPRSLKHTSEEGPDALGGVKSRVVESLGERGEGAVSPDNPNDHENGIEGSHPEDLVDRLLVAGVGAVKTEAAA